METHWLTVLALCSLSTRWEASKREEEERE
jgi:hypothetical protein